MINLLVDKFIKPVMSAHGFRKDKFTWNRGKTDIIHMLDIQQSQWNSKDDISFTINVGACVMRERQIFNGGKEIPRFIHEINCFPSVRVGHLLCEKGRFKDIWWELKSLNDIDIVGKELEAIIQNKCIPFLDNLDSMDKVITFTENEIINRYTHPGALISYAILKYLNHSPEEANKILNPMLADNKGKFWHNKVKEVLDRLNNLPIEIKN